MVDKNTEELKEQLQKDLEAREERKITVEKHIDRLYTEIKRCEVYKTKNEEDINALEDKYVETVRKGIKAFITYCVASLLVIVAAIIFHSGLALLALLLTFKVCKRKIVKAWKEYNKAPSEAIDKIESNLRIEKHIEIRKKLKSKYEYHLKSIEKEIEEIKEMLRQVDEREIEKNERDYNTCVHAIDIFKEVEALKETNNSSEDGFTNKRKYIEE